jgi:hypothetical protein
LRAALAEKSYATLDDAYKQLMALHLEYPEVTIPGADTMHVMVYSHHDDHSMPIDKIVLKVRVLQEGGVRLAVKGKKPEKKVPEVKALMPMRQPVVEVETVAAPVQEPEPVEEIVEEQPKAASTKTAPKKTITEKLADTVQNKGKFTSMVIQRRRKRSAPVRKSGKKEE